MRHLIYTIALIAMIFSVVASSQLNGLHLIFGVIILVGGSFFSELELKLENERKEEIIKLLKKIAEK